jgi:hypothetical protein
MLDELAHNISESLEKAKENNECTASEDDKDCCSKSDDDTPKPN